MPVPRARRSRDCSSPTPSPGFTEALHTMKSEWAHDVLPTQGLAASRSQAVPAPAGRLRNGRLAGQQWTGPESAKSQRTPSFATCKTDSVDFVRYQDSVDV